MAIKIKLNGATIATCYGSDILGLTAKQEAKMFIESYRNIFHKITVNGEEIV